VPVSFHSEQTDYSFSSPEIAQEWIHKLILQEKKRPGEINIIFTSNEYLLEINNKYLNHNYFTDVITFDYSESEVISGDVFISVDQVRLNADEYTVTFKQELFRVIIHGILHLLGYNDKTAEERENMRKQENDSLGKLAFDIDGEDL
jgi:rRNA maturation RNase YbeY